jgi:predicted aspartyl protease
VRNVAVGILTRELRLDAIVDTGATYCIVPPSAADALGFDSDNRIDAETSEVVGGEGQVTIDLHRCEYVRVGTAKAYDVMFGVCNIGAHSRFMLVGLTIITHFRTTFDFDEGLVLFRSRNA